MSTNKALDFTSIQSVQAQAICNLVSLNNAFSAIMLKSASYVKITHSQALEFLSNTQGHKSYTAFKLAFNANTTPVFNFSTKNLSKSFERVFGAIESTESHKNLYTLLQTFFSTYNPNTDKYEPHLYYGLGFITIARWNKVTKAYLDLNLPDNTKFNNKLVFSLLITANNLSHTTQEVAELNELDEFEPDFDQIFNLKAIKDNEYVTTTSNLLSGEIVTSHSVQHTYIKRNVNFYTAIHFNDPRTKPEYFIDKNTYQTENDLAIKSVADKSNQSKTHQAYLKANIRPHLPESSGWFESVSVGTSEFDLIIQNFPNLTHCTIDEDWTAMTLKPNGISTRIWSDNAVDYYNQMMDAFKYYFQDQVENAHYDIRKVYINSSGLIMYHEPNLKFKTKIGVTISANDFCIVANVVLSRKIAPYIPYSTFGQYMLFFTYMLMRNLQGLSVGIDNEMDLNLFAD